MEKLDINSMTIQTDSSEKPPLAEAKENNVIAVWSNSQYKFMDFLQILKQFTTRCTFHFTEDGLRIKFLDPHHVCIIDLVLPQFMWQPYSCTEPITITINLETLYRALKGFQRKTDTYSFKIQPNIFAIQVNNDVTVVLEGLIEDLDEDTPTPTITPRIGFEMSCLLDFKTALTQVSKNKSQLFFQTKRSVKGIEFSLSDHEDHSEAKIIRKFSNNNYFRLAYDYATPLNPLQTWYPSIYLLDFIKVIFESSTYFLEYETEEPLNFIVKFGCGIDNKGGLAPAYLKMCLAPRVTDEEYQTPQVVNYIRSKRAFKDLAPIWKPLAANTKPSE